MSMFCYQCQEAAGNKACVNVGICGKNEEVAQLQDSLIVQLKVISIWATKEKIRDEAVDRFILEGLFATITNVNFDATSIKKMIEKSTKIITRIKSPAKVEAGILAEKNEDIRSLKELILYGLKGIAAYAVHAFVLGEKDSSIYQFTEEALAKISQKDIGADELTALTLKTGEFGAKTMALLDAANTKHFGNPVITQVSTGTKKGPAILVSGHDLLDLEELLKQTEGKGIHIYTHGEMLPAHAYPGLKKYKHLAGNFGTSWYAQQKEFPKFNGAILFTTNCIQKPLDSYKDRVFTTGVVGWPGLTHIPDRDGSGQKDFSPVIKKAIALGGPEETSGKTLTIGFAHDQVLQLAGKVVDAIKSGAIKRFVVMAGCDGRHKEREYFTDIAKQLPKDAVILTAGCAKFRYNMLDLGDIGGIPRVLDAGQCNDSYSLVVIALKLKEAFGLKDINELPVSYDIAWYEQKAVIVLLALLSLGVKGIRLGPTVPSFLSPNVVKVLVDSFGIKPVGEVSADVEAIMKGK